jgi:hypothetical protein
MNHEIQIQITPLENSNRTTSSRGGFWKRRGSSVLGGLG